MIITRSPLRVTLGGGGTDLPSYYRQHGGFLVAAAINQYVYVTLVQTPLDEIILRYSKIERVKSIDEIQHPIIREALRLTGVTGRNIEITSMADIPAGTGLGSSGSFGTCLLRVLHKFKRHFVHPGEPPEGGGPRASRVGRAVNGSGFYRTPAIRLRALFFLCPRDPRALHDALCRERAPLALVQ